MCSQEEPKAIIEVPEKKKENVSSGDIKEIAENRCLA